VRIFVACRCFGLRRAHGGFFLFLLRGEGKELVGRILTNSSSAFVLLLLLTHSHFVSIFST